VVDERPPGIETDGNRGAGTGTVADGGTVVDENALLNENALVDEDAFVDGEELVDRSALLDAGVLVEGAEEKGREEPVKHFAKSDADTILSLTSFVFGKSPSGNV
jgi:hypothetical protein